MIPFPEIDTELLSRWLYDKSGDSGGSGTSAEILIQLLQSSLGPTLLSVDPVRHALITMVATDDVHHGLHAVNLATVDIVDDLAEAYLFTLAYEHSRLHCPPFAYLDSTLWYYRSWTVSHLEELVG